jgi:tRNA G10  N-methylase Trm11
VSYTFYASFIPGLQECIAEVIQERLPDVVIHKLLDGAALFETQCSYDKLNFFCFNNIFAVAGIMEHCSPDQALEAHISAVIAGKTASGKAPAGIPPAAAAEKIIAQNSKKFHSFRIVVSKENKPAAVSEKLRAQAEQYITRLSGLSVNRSRPDTEFWFLYRSEDFSVFMKRLTLRASWEKSLHPGELPPPLAWMLCRLGGLKHSDTVLDPFCGYGSIPFAALKYFHITKCITCDNNSEAAAYTRGRFKDRASGSFVFHKTDFRSLVSLIPEKSVDVIITDPPWGFYSPDKNTLQDGEANISIKQLYEDMFRVFGVLLKEGGRAVVLCANNDEILGVAPGHFELQNNIPILLSGKKTSIFQFKFT